MSLCLWSLYLLIQESILLALETAVFSLVTCVDYALQLSMLKGTCRAHNTGCQSLKIIDEKSISLRTFNSCPTITNVAHCHWLISLGMTSLTTYTIDEDGESVENRMVKAAPFTFFCCFS